MHRRPVPAVGEERPLEEEGCQLGRLLLCGGRASQQLEPTGHSSQKSQENHGRHPECCQGAREEDEARQTSQREHFCDRQNLGQEKELLPQADQHPPPRMGHHLRRGYRSRVCGKREKVDRICRHLRVFQGLQEDVRHPWLHQRQARLVLP